MQLILLACSIYTYAHCALCSGTSGFVQLAFNLETGDQVAIKFIERGAHMQRIVARELLNHRLCALHPHIVQLKVRLLPSSGHVLPRASLLPVIEPAVVLMTAF